MTMRLHVWCVAVWLLHSVVVQAADPMDDASVDAARARIQIDRQTQNALYDAQRDACLTRFAVTDCQNEVDKRHREAQARLKREEVELNDSVRRQRAQEQANRTQAKLDARMAQDASHALGAPQDREGAQQEKKRNHPLPVATRERGAKPVNAVNARERDEKRKAYAEKQQTLEKKRQERAKRLLEQGTQKPGLAIPP